MIGRICMLDATTMAGFIKMENGLVPRFDYSSVMTYDVTGLALNQLVSFDIENGPAPKAINVRVKKENLPPARDESKHDPVRLRYTGFKQRGNARDYSFEHLATGAEPVQFVVAITMTLFARHHLGIQDGPALCLYLLNNESRLAPAGCEPQLFRSLTDADVQIFVDSKAAAEAGSHRNRPGRARVAPAAPPTE